MKRIVVGISGSSGPIYGIRLLEVLRSLPDIETDLVISRAAARTIVLEAEGWTPEAVAALAHRVHAVDDLAAPISSGSYRADAMVVAPCSMKTLSAVAHASSPDLLARAADVTLKERRPLVLVTRETPLSLGHLRNMVAATEMGAIILPPVPAFYHRPRTIEDLVDHTIGKVLDCLGVPHDLFRRWDGGGLDCGASPGGWA